VALPLPVAHASETWCWSPDLKTATCIYDGKEQCRELVKLRGAFA
jgi:hypothetical protein